MSKKQQRVRLVRKLQGEGSLEILGYICWWSIRNVDITQNEFIEILKECELNTKYAREHNYLSAFKRALKNMEQARIIRIVEENSQQIICQFTAENKVADKNDPRFNYDPETVIYIDKNRYRDTKDFKQALVKGDKDIRDALAQYFLQEKVRYNSNDITRYVQKILNDVADILSLRDQGCLYFIPSEYADIMQRVQRMVRKIQGGPGAFQSVPLPNVGDSRAMVSNAVTGEIEQSIKKLDEDLDEILNSGKEVTEVWKATRIRRIDQLRERLDRYAEVLNGEGDKYDQKAVKLEGQIRKVGVMGRKLNV